MGQSKSIIKPRLLSLLWRYVFKPIVNKESLRVNIHNYKRYMADLRAYQAIEEAEPLEEEALHPCVTDWMGYTPFDSHYTYQSIWAAQQITRFDPPDHVDIGSLALFAVMLTQIVAVKFVDIRPLKMDIDNFQSIEGNLLDLPFENQSIRSLSCLHVIEHVGLGRYGDPLQPDGTTKAASELQRVLAPGGRLLLTTPIGRQRTCFNAHRVHAPQAVLDMVPELELLSFSAVDDTGTMCWEANPADFVNADYVCGMFVFARPMRQN